MTSTWFRLLGDDIDDVDCVELNEYALTVHLREEAKRLYKDSALRGVSHSSLVVYRNQAAFDANEPLKIDASITRMGRRADDPMIVEAPLVFKPPRPDRLWWRPPIIQELPNAAGLAVECEGIPLWLPSTVHHIPLLHKLMEPLGTCTQRGQVFWREEERQIASFVVGRRSGLSPSLAKKRGFLVGAPGVGKSLMLILAAFYAALIQRENVLIVRQVGSMRCNQCVIFLGHKHDQVVYFAHQIVCADDAMSIYRALKTHHAFPSVRLLLDGFNYSQVPRRLRTFHLLATNELPDLESSEVGRAYCCLHPAWRRDDLFLLGGSVYRWRDEQAMASRYYHSGGSVRQFVAMTTHTAGHVREQVSQTMNCRCLLSHSDAVTWGENESEGLRRTFVPRDRVSDPWAYRSMTTWEQRVDSAFMLLELQARLDANERFRPLV